MSKERKRKNDMILIAVCLLLAAVLFAVYMLSADEGACAVVRIDGTETARYSLSADGRYVLNGGTNVIVIEDGTVRMHQADCPDGICISQGKIHLNGQCITCLPNRVTVTVEGGEGDVDLYVG